MGSPDLEALIRNLRPALQSGTYAFCAWSGEEPPKDVPAIMLFRETEGWTLIVEAEIAAARGLLSHFQAAWITLGVNSELNAVGLLAAVTRALAEAGIPCNVVSAVCHDHLFVPVGRGAEALAALQQLTIDRSCR